MLAAEKFSPRETKHIYATAFSRFAKVNFSLLRVSARLTRESVTQPITVISQPLTSLGREKEAITYLSYVRLGGKQQQQRALTRRSYIKTGCCSFDDQEEKLGLIYDRRF